METQIATWMAEGDGVASKMTTNVRSQLGSNEAKLVIVFASTDYALTALMKSVTADFPKATVLGASTSGEFTEKGDAKRATSIFALAGDYEVVAGIGHGLKANPEKAVADALAELPRSKPGFDHCTAILLLDPLAGNGEETTLAAAALLGEGVRLAGGAAGDDLKMTATEVGLGEVAASDAVVIALIFSKKPLGVGVSHGHSPLSGPLKVTKSSGNVVSESTSDPHGTCGSKKLAPALPPKKTKARTCSRTRPGSPMATPSKSARRSHATTTARSISPAEFPKARWFASPRARPRVKSTARAKQLGSHAKASAEMHPPARSYSTASAAI